LSSTTIIRFVTARPEFAQSPDYPSREDRTIPLPSYPETDGSPASPQTLALAALGWVLESEERAARFLDLTGLDPETLRAGLGDPLILAAPLEFLTNYEPDLIRAAEALAVTPEELVAAKDALQS
jgi:Protein of unknown function (DUF3572)